MIRSRKSSRILSAAIFVLLEIAALAMLDRSSTIQNTWLNRISHRTLGVLWSGSEKVHNYFSLESQNESLAEENFELRRKVLEYERIINENLSLEGLRQYDSSGRYEMIPARIIRISRNSQQNYVIINKGSADGIKPNSGLITSTGVAGIISCVDEHFSYGLSFMNSNFTVSARIGRGGMVAPLQWRGLGSDQAVLKDLSFHNMAAPGDTIWTSGYSDFFPAGIPLGIAEGTEHTFGATAEVKVRLFQDFSSLEYVTVIRDRHQDEIIESEL